MNVTNTKWRLPYLVNKIRCLSINILDYHILKKIQRKFKYQFKIKELDNNVNESVQSKRHRLQKGTFCGQKSVHGK